MSEFETLDHYELIGLPYNATSGETHLKGLYLIRTMHPDQSTGGIDSAPDFQRFAAAYWTFIDPEKRVAYVWSDK